MIPNLVKQYQCPGCIHDNDECYKPYSPYRTPCSNHSPATYLNNAGKIALGLPPGFNRIPEAPVDFCFVKLEDEPFKFDEYNIPIWATMDEDNLVVKTYQPRLNKTLIVIMENRNMDWLRGRAHYQFIDFTNPESKKRIEGCDL